ncbi:MAG: hypothetical protein ACEQSR_01370 [Candidatus Methylacidiphilales bacterium]
MSNENNIYQFPDGDADVSNCAYAAVMSKTVENSETVLTVAQMTGAGTLNLVLGTRIRAGHNLTVKVSADGTNRVLTLGTGFTGNAYTVTANKNAVLSFKYDGSKFVNTAAILTN